MRQMAPRNMLFSLDGKDMGASYTKLVNASVFYGDCEKMIGYFGPYGGRFTDKTSEAYIVLIKKAIKDPSKLGTSKPFKDSYADWRAKQGLGMAPWYLYGNVYENVGIIYRGKHTKTVGIQRGVKVPQIGFSGESKRMVSVAWYASLVEFGSKYMDPNPLFGPAAVKFTGKYWPQSVQGVKKAMEQAALKYVGKFADGGTKTASAGDASSVMGQSSLSTVEEVAHSNPNADFKGQSEEVAFTGKSGTAGDMQRLPPRSAMEKDADAMADAFFAQMEGGM